MDARRRQTVSVQWQAVGANEAAGDQRFKGNWREFLCEVIGHRIYVLPFLAHLSKVFVLDLNAQAWQELELNGKASIHLNGGSVVTWDGKLVFIKRDTFRLRTVPFLDTVLLEWSEREVSGELMYPGHTNVCDYWEARRLVLINSAESGSEAPNTTFVMNIDTLELRRLEAKGPPPSRRSMHSSILVEQQKKWIIIGGKPTDPIKSLPDLCILDFRSWIPTWTNIRPFSQLKSIALCSPMLVGSFVLIIGGYRSGLENSVVCCYDLRTGRMEEGVPTSGSRPYLTQFSHLRAIKPNDREFIIISARKRVGMNRVFKGKMDL